MEKLNWKEPEIMVENFEPNEYVAACITGTIQCAYPGNGRTNGQTNVFDDYNGRQSGWYEDRYGLLHGICGNNATISFNGDTGSGYEYVNGRPASNRPIYNIKGYNSEEGTYYNVEWNSKVDNSDEYNHVGRLIITNIDDAHPNHS
ncbi:MAG: hypothetical protein ACLRT4_14575 [Thomasclavelia sp.]